MGDKVHIHGNSRFCDEVASEAWSLAKSGWSDADIASCLAVSPRTFRRWRRRYPDFSQGIDEARAGAARLVHHAAFEQAVGFAAKTERVIETARGPVVVKVSEYHPPNTAAQKWWLRHQRRTAEHQAALSIFHARLGEIASNNKEIAQ